MLETLGLEYHYQQGKKIVFPDIGLKRGQRLLISGFSGCGKTTLLSLIAGALKLQAGDIKFDGINYSTMSPLLLDQFRADHIGYIFQTLNLIPFLSVSENIALGVRFSQSRKSKVSNLNQEVVRLVSSLGLEREALKIPVSRLSVGQQQRVAAARALIGNPDLILADEPTSALDSDTTKKFLNEVMETFDSNKQAIIMVSHDASIAPYFDTVIDFNKHYA
ncbi:ATP-binding cassette domain-containing protein [Candidatus Pseudothioglobus singularis]|jgi:putative ABC transport system ATP-binding protein|nr:ATP-binding cassette domain-containing protein [Candidatus Pseudothioglobus singularis]MDA7438057.1 ATP-binding cassette domain-containing protein [Candidatus Pseudothioglobus singularis]MDB0021851.1 ATP-binding cassette domain-containing protein [Candidatus Pseudothioglobus singularis]MDB4597943.1 ATP-binding cassette domain-containing protein [Candidatus Pseudothioglobus singularis]